MLTGFEPIDSGVFLSKIKQPVRNAQVHSKLLSFADTGQYLSDGQFKKLRRYVKDRADLARMRAGSRGVIDELIVELLVSTGLRASELCDLNIGDLPLMAFMR